MGVGLIGGSIGLACRARDVACRVVGIGRDRDRLEEAVRLGAIDEWSTDFDSGVSKADIVVICTPVDRISDDAIRAATASPAGALITDAGSTKGAIVAAVGADEGALAKFVGAHPIAGSERQGVAHARGDLFAGRVCILTPTDQTPLVRLDLARRFWSGLGCRLIEVDPALHDHQLAITSHLPHAVAAALASIVGPNLVPMAAGAYRDGTRVAAADAALWSAIFLENRRAVLDALDAFSSSIGTFRDALDSNDAGRIVEWWEAARRNRLAFEAGVASGASGG